MLSSKLLKNGHLRILNDLDSAGRGKKRDEEEGGMTRRKDERGGRMNEEEGWTRRKERREGRSDEESCKKNEK